MNQNLTKAGIIATGDTVVLRDWLPSDVDSYIRWQTHGEWRFYDAPWEGNCASMTEEQKERVRKRFLERHVEEELSWPRRHAAIATKGHKPLGWVSRYAKDFPDVWFVGVDICEDEYLNRGLGTEALGLWIDHLFSNSEVHRIGLDTWSFNPRMMRVAEKIGFVYEGAEREMIQWQGERLDAVHFGMLRREWVAKRAEQ